MTPSSLPLQPPIAARAENALPLIFGSVCSGIEAASVAWHPLGWRAAFFAEINPFACAVLRQHWPATPLHGDFTTIQPGDYAPIDLLVGGTPCQDFSIAGLRAGLAGERGGLTIEFVRLAGRLRPRWLVWENVPGVLSIDGGSAFGAFLGGLGECGYGFAYRVLDAQHFGVPQRRRRVFVVGYLGDWRPAAAVLFEPESLRGDPAPRRETGKGIARPIASCAKGGGGWRADADTADNLIAFHGSQDPNISGHVTHPLGRQSNGMTACIGIAPPLTSNPYGDHESREGLLICFGGNRQSGAINIATAVNAHGGPHGRLDFESETFIVHSLQEAQTGVREYADAGSLRANGPGHDPVGTRIRSGMSVRRLLPVEWEKLQGLPPGYTAITYRGKPAADGPRYRAIGNSMAVPCMRFLGERINQVSALLSETEAAPSPARERVA